MSGQQTKVVRLTGTTDGSGDLVVTGEFSILGWLVAVEWVDGDFADGVDAVLSVVDTPSGVDQTLLTLTDANDDKWYFPTGPEHDQAGAETGTRALLMINGTLKLVVSSGGDTKTGGCFVVYHSR
jgi:hypothetical protein